VRHHRGDPPEPSPPEELLRSLDQDRRRDPQMKISARSGKLGITVIAFPISPRNLLATGYVSSINPC